MAAPSDEPRDPETGRLAELAERRARRAAEAGLIDRAERAERTVGALERRLDEAEGRLEIAQRERTTLSASLVQAQGELTAALQREFAEQRMRIDQEGDATGSLADLEAEITRLGSDHDAAEARATALTRALKEARHEVHTAKARLEAERQAVAVDGNRDGLRHELGELRALAEGLHGSLHGERQAREEAERALAFERERAEAEVTLLQHELDRRTQVHDAVSGQIFELLSALEGVRGRAARTDELEQAIATLEAEQRRTGVRLSDTRELLGAREAELIAVEDRLVAREAELETLKEEAGGHRAARREVEEAVASAQARAAGLERDLEEERRTRERIEERLEVERRRYASAETELRRELEAGREGSAQRLAVIERTVDDLRAEAAHAELTAELAEHVERKQQVEAALVALRAEFEQARQEGSDRAEREAAIEALVGDLVETAHRLRTGFEQELGTLTDAHDADLARERGEFATELADMEQRVGELRRRLTQAADQLRDDLEEERSARWVAEAELAREVDDRALAEQRASEARDALSAELAQLRLEAAANPMYDVPPSGPLMPSADHPALARPAAPAREPAVVGDLERAMDRLRGGGTGEIASAPAGPIAADDVVCAERENAAVTDPPAVVDAIDTEAPSAPGEPSEHVAPSASSGATFDRTTETSWFAPRLAAFARTDAAAAERLLLTSLAVQAAAVAKDVTYELALPESGRYRVQVVRGSGVSVAPVEADRPQEVEFRLEASAAELAPLAGGAAPRRLAGVTVRGRRRRLRRLLRALQAPVGLAQLRSAGAQPRPADLLAMLCGGVPTDVVLGADFTVAYDVADPRGGRLRVLVRARPDGRLGIEPESATVPDAALTLDLPELLSALAGGSSAAVSGDHLAAETLHRWLRGVQGP